MSVLRAVAGVVAARRAFEVPATIANIYGWWRGDSGITLNGATVSAWADRYSGKVLSQGTAAMQPTYVAADANFSSRQTLSFDDGDRLGSTLAASAWTFLHDGTGGTMVACWRCDPAEASAGICGTAYVTGARVGHSLGNWSGGNMRQHLGDGVTGRYNNIPGTPAYGTVVWAAVGVTPTNFVYDASSKAYASTAHSGTPSGAAPHSTFVVGDEGSDGNKLKGSIAEVIIYNRMISSAEMAALGTYFVGRYGAAV